MSSATILDFWEPTEDPTLVLRYFYFHAEAQLAALQLRQLGIPSFITSSNAQTMLPLGQGWIGLHIRKRDFTNAVAALQAADMWEEPNRPSTKDAKMNTNWILGALAIILAASSDK